MLGVQVPRNHKVQGAPVVIRDLASLLERNFPLAGRELIPIQKVWLIHEAACILPVLIITRCGSVDFSAFFISACAITKVLDRQRLLVNGESPRLVVHLDLVRLEVVVGFRDLKSRWSVFRCMKRKIG